MAKWITGGSAALVVWIGSAMAAEAQNPSVTTTGPSLVQTTDAQCTVTADVSGTSGTFAYWINIKVNGVIKHNKMYYGSGAQISKVVMGLGTWGLQAGALFETKVTVGTACHILTTTVENGYYGMRARDLRAAPLPAALKEEELCLVGSDDEAAA